MFYYRIADNVHCTPQTIVHDTIDVYMQCIPKMGLFQFENTENAMIFFSQCMSLTVLLDFS